jgi:hypothetical protein
MSVFTVDMENQPGELARLCEAMAAGAFVADDEAGAQAALLDIGFEYEMRPALTVRMDNQPGSGAVAFRKLADAGVNTDLLLPVRVSDEVFFAVICVDDVEKARAALGDLVVSAGLAA